MSNTSPSRLVWVSLLIIALAVSAMLALGGKAHADTPPTLPGGARDVIKVDPAPAGPRITVTFSNGATSVLRPCIYEDGRRCYWLADQRGNGRGKSFIVARGRVHFLNLAGFDPLA